MAQANFRCFIHPDELWESIEYVASEISFFPYKKVANQLKQTDYQDMRYSAEDDLTGLRLSLYADPSSASDSWERGDVHIWYCWAPSNILSMTEISVKTDHCVPSPIFALLRKRLAKLAKLKSCLVYRAVPTKVVPTKMSSKGLELAKQGALVVDEWSPYFPVRSFYELNAIMLANENYEQT
jgi:hypothetical protein